jgi:hypothetical protein
MVFVKIVGGSEIYNFRIQSFVHLYSENGVIHFQTSAQQNEMCQSAVAPPRRPRSHQPPRRLRSHRARGLHAARAAPEASTPPEPRSRPP